MYAAPRNTHGGRKWAGVTHGHGVHAVEAARSLGDEKRHWKMPKWCVQSDQDLSPICKTSERIVQALTIWVIKIQTKCTIRSPAGEPVSVKKDRNRHFFLEKTPILCFSESERLVQKSLTWKLIKSGNCTRVRASASSW